MSAPEIVSKLPAPPFEQREVSRVFDAWPARVQASMHQVRRLIFEVADATPGVGPIEETLKWGEPAYLTPATGAGSTIRLAWKDSDPHRVGLYFNCRTDLLEHFRTLFPRDFGYEGRRALKFGLEQPFPATALAQCIELALTHHLRRRAGARASPQAPEATGTARPERPFRSRGGPL